MDELNKVDQVVGKIKDDYEKIRVDQIMGRTSNAGSQTGRSTNSQ